MEKEVLIGWTINGLTHQYLKVVVEPLGTVGTYPRHYLAMFVLFIAVFLRSFSNSMNSTEKIFHKHFVPTSFS